MENQLNKRTIIIENDSDHIKPYIVEDSIISLEPGNYEITVTDTLFGSKFCVTKKLPKYTNSNLWKKING